MNNIKSKIKNIIGLIFRHYCRFFNVLRGKSFILMYHRVKDSQEHDDLYDSAMFVTNKTLEMHIDELSQDFNIVSLDQMGEDVRPQCILTFDDGWADNYHNALPVLSARAVPATIFITVNYIGTSKSFWFHSIWLIANRCLLANDEDKFFSYFKRHIKYDGDLKINEDNVAIIIGEFKSFKPEEIDIIVENALTAFGIDNKSTSTMLTWNQVNELINSGVTIGSHGMNHYILTQLDDIKIKYEITESLSVLKNNVKTISEYFCYPNGNYNNGVINTVKLAGYVGAIGTEIGYNTSKTNKYCLNRIAIHDDISSTPGLLWFRIFQACLENRQ